MLLLKSKSVVFMWSVVRSIDELSINVADSAIPSWILSDIQQNTLALTIVCNFVDTCRQASKYSSYIELWLNLTDVAQMQRPTVIFKLQTGFYIWRYQN